MKTIFTLGMLSLIGLALVGCEQPSAKLHPQGEKFLLTTEPAEAKTPTDVKKLLAEETPPNEVTLVGRVSAGDVDPFVAGKGSFMLSQMADASHAGGDPSHSDDCPFCKRKLKNAPRAIIEFKDDSGEILAHGAKRLFGIDRDSVVIVKGKATYDEKMNTLTVDASGIFIRS